MATGKINVQTENIFPIIKKFLYSDQEIFLRELVSNAIDATQKIKTLASLGEYKDDLGELKVEVLLDKANKTITIRDYGIGMTKAEIEKYITEIAFSGAESFIKKYKDKTDEKNAIIGHFGLGFYSAFMVAKKVEILSRSHKNKQKAARWVCEGNPSYEISDDKREWRGTDIILHVNEDGEEYLEEAKINELLNKYCKFLPVPVIFGTKTIQEDDPSGEKDEEGNVKKISKEVPNQINNTEPAWTNAPADLNDEDYKKFYHELYPMSWNEEPIFHIHLNVDFPFNLTGILYFPKLKENVEVQKNKIQLYSNQVFVTDSVEGIVPEFLTLLHGVIDSPDIPLNVSRSYLQSDSNVKKISSHISKKVADKLEEMFKKDRKDFESKWPDIQVFMQYGMLSDDKFYDRAKKFMLLKNTDGKFFTIEEYQKKVKDNQTDKDDKLVMLYASDAQEQHSYIEQAKNKGYDVLLLDGPLASHFISRLEQKMENISFARVDADTMDNLIKKEKDIESKLSEDDEKKVKPILESAVNKEKFVIQMEAMEEDEKPVVITQSEFARRMKEQERLSGQAMFGAMPEMYNVVVNKNHQLIGKLKDMKEKEAKILAQQAIDLALLEKGLLKGEELTRFIDRGYKQLN